MSCYASAFEFYAGESKTLKIQMNSLNRAHNCKKPFTIDVGDDIEIEVPASPANLVFTKITSPAVVLDNGPLGEVHVDLTDVETNQMNSGTIVMRVIKAGKKSVGIAEAACQLLQVPDC